MRYQPSSAGHKLRAAVIGCGRMGAFTSQHMKDFAPDCWFPLSHIEALQSCPQIEIVAVSDMNQDSLKQVRDSYDVPKTYDDPLEMLASHKLDLLCIATRTKGRTGLIEAAYESGITAFHIEKPLCNSVAELARLSKIFAQDDVFITYGTIRRLLPPYKQAKQMLRAGEIGELKSILVEHDSGMLFWSHPHSIDLCLYYTNNIEPKTIMADFDEVHVNKVDNEVENDPTLNAALITFEQNIVAHVTAASGMNTRLLGSAGEIMIKGNGHSVILHKPHGSNPYKTIETVWDKFDSPSAQGTGAAITMLANCLAGDESAIAENAETKESILLGQALLFDLALSAILGESVVAKTSLKTDLTVKGFFNGKPA